MANSIDYRTVDRRERAELPQEAIREVLTGLSATLWTSLPCIIQSFNPAQMTVTALPAITGQAIQPDGSFKPIKMPLLLDVPVVFPGGGGFTLTFPIQPGDECLVVFADRCINSWWYHGGVQGQEEIRLHDLSDGFAFVGVRSLPRAIPAINSSATQLRSDDGTTMVSIAQGAVSVVAPTTITLTAPQIILNGQITAGNSAGAAGEFTVTGDINVAGQVISNGVSLHDHTHKGVVAGSGNSGVPN